MKITNALFYICTLLLAAAIANPVISAPAAPTLVSPLGLQQEATPVFKWTTVSSATWYRVWASANSGLEPIWLKARDHCDILEPDVCIHDPGISVGRSVTWRVRAYDGTELGAWSERGSFWRDLERPNIATLISPLTSPLNSNQEFSWYEVVDATWYKLQIESQPGEMSGGIIFNQWFRVSKNPSLCDGGICTYTVLSNITEDFRWRVRSYNAAGLSPWTEYQSIIQEDPANLLSAVPNPYEIVDEEANPVPNLPFSIIVSNDSSIETVTGITFLPRLGEPITLPGIPDTDECGSVITELGPGQSCTVTRIWAGDSSHGDTEILPLASDNAEVLEIAIEYFFVPD